MSREQIKLLLIEDNPGDARLVLEMLREWPDVELLWADSLEAGLEGLKNNRIDVVLLDLGLPDSLGMETFYAVHKSAPNVPIVINSRYDEDIPIDALKSGAQDYLVKGQTDGNLLIRSLRYAIERYRLLEELESAREREDRARETKALDKISRAAANSQIPQIRSKSLRQNAREPFEQLVEEYENLLDLAVEQQTLDVDNHVSEKLRQLAAEIGALRAGPRDVVEVHRTALTKKSDQESPQVVRTYSEEGRFMVLELMGHLVSYYRSIPPKEGVDEVKRRIK